MATQTPNRTIVELKYTFNIQQMVGSHAPNRTIVELKWGAVKGMACT